MIDPTGEMATSCVAFLRSKEARAKFKMLMEAGDVTDKPPVKSIGKPTPERKEVIDREVACIVERLKNGETVEWIAKSMSLHPMTIRARLKTRGLKAKDFRTTLRHKKIRELSEQGLTRYKIAKKLGTEWETVNYALNDSKFAKQG